ncbi:hypothetical protein U1Q18_047658, partial [Sarracenia purpurea var. burkii]
SIAGDAAQLEVGGAIQDGAGVTDWDAEVRTVVPEMRVPVSTKVLVAHEDDWAM